MTLKNTTERWGAVSKLFHWIIVALLLVVAGIGLSMGDLPNGPRKINVYALHKAIGLTILALVALRLAWRLYAGAPRAVDGTPPWQQRVAAITHAALYLLMLAIPLSGWVLNSAAGYPLQWFKLFNLPALTGRDRELQAMAEQAHALMFWLLALLVLAHVGAALYHHLFRNDDTLRRMLPAWRRKPSLPPPQESSP
ncbi:cytochrome b [Pseudoxanthomonas mexicana]|uniref:cytochrome b n=1 Tax=Pseudoxanthomonas mexicana TaxID=128785 RepID=UPI00398B096A